MEKRSITYCGGFWSTNIGNSFFDLAIYHILQKVCPDAKVTFCDEQPGNYWVQSGKNPVNSLDFIKHIDSEYVVIAGPLLGKDLPFLWEDAFEELYRRGVKILLLSAGCISYTKEELDICRSFLKKYPPHVLMTRDQYTYDNFKDLATHSYNGICCAFYIPDFYTTTNTTLGNYVVLNFDGKGVPPRVGKLFSILGLESEPSFNSGKNTTNSKEFDFNGEHWDVTYNYSPIDFKNILSGPKKSPSHINDLKVIRTKHRASSTSRRSVFTKPNTFVSDIPYNYFDIYGNTNVTFSNRVHACVLTLAYGKPAMFFSNTKRGKLLERFEDLKEIKNKPVTIQQNILDNEKAKQLEFLSEILND